MVVTDSVVQLYERLKKAGMKMVEWEERNYIVFDNMMDEAILFMRRRKL